MPPQEMTGMANSVRPKRRYIMAGKIGKNAGVATAEKSAIKCFQRALTHPRSPFNLFK
jgi:hypothetical protein